MSPNGLGKRRAKVLEREGGGGLSQ